MVSTVCMYEDDYECKSGHCCEDICSALACIGDYCEGQYCSLPSMLSLYFLYTLYYMPIYPTFKLPVWKFE